jgi:hypothetical protein
VLSALPSATANLFHQRDIMQVVPEHPSVGVNDANAAVLNQRMAAISQELRSAAFGALGLVLLPPLFTLLAGLILGWIGRGFLQRPKHG